MGGERGGAAGGGARERLGERRCKEARVHKAERREEDRVGEHQEEVGECMRDVVGRRPPRPAAAAAARPCTCPRGGARHHDQDGQDDGVRMVLP
nr:unnamed protein product [Digitaria exilis]